jgi:hypothetical protein
MELRFGDVAPPCVIEVEVERDGERPAAAGEEHVGRRGEACSSRRLA